MISAEDLKKLLSDLESDRVERTVSTSNTDKFSQAVCAFANDLPNHGKPGYLIIGARDDGAVAGAEITDQLLQNLAALRSNGNILPLPQIAVAKVELEGKSLAVVEVLPSNMPPVRYVGRTYVRVGPRKAIASEQEERTLIEKRMSSAKSFDASPAPESGVDDLSLDLFAAYRKQVIDKEVIEANHRSTTEQLAALRFFDTRHNCATYAGILLFGKNPRYYLPGAYIQYLRINGTSLADDPIIDQAEISGDLLSILRELDIRIKANIRTSLVKQTTLTEKEIYDYPAVAVRELVMNAIAHRDYQSNAPVKLYWFDDRVEIHNPGSPFGVVTMQTLETASDYRNPIIAETMKPLGYINKYGYGIQRAQASLKANGSLPAEFTCQGNVFTAIIRKR